MQPSADDIPGWLTRQQAVVLAEEAARVPVGGTVVEIGSHHGRSTVVLGAAVPSGARVVAVDPFVVDWRYGATGTEQALRRNLAAARLEGIVEVRVTTSAEALADWRNHCGQPVDLVYIDGKHDYRSVRHDLGWAGLVPSGGTVLVHDAFSSVGVTLGLLATLLTGRGLTYIDRTGSLARLRVAHPTAADRLRPVAALPWWLRNLVVKVLMRLHVGRVAGLLGHHDTADPY